MNTNLGINWNPRWKLDAARGERLVEEVLTLTHSTSPSIQFQSFAPLERKKQIVVQSHVRESSSFFSCVREGEGIVKSCSGTRQINKRTLPAKSHSKVPKMCLRGSILEIWLCDRGEDTEHFVFAISQLDLHFHPLKVQLFFSLLYSG